MTQKKRGHVIREAEIRVMQPQAEERGQPPSRGARAPPSPLKLEEGG